MGAIDARARTYDATATMATNGTSIAMMTSATGRIEAHKPADASGMPSAGCNNDVYSRKTKA